MLRKFVFAVCAVVLGAGVALADEAKGKLKKVDADKNSIIVTDKDGKDHTFMLNEKTEILDTKGKAVSGGLKASAFKTVGFPVVITYDKVGDKITVTKVKMES